MLSSSNDKPLDGDEENFPHIASHAAQTSPDIETGETKRALKARHAQMIALGGTIGTGLFVGSGATLAKGGPAFILMTYMTLSILVFFIVTAITTVAAYLPVSGGTMSYYGHRNVSDSLGFAMGWLYFYSLGILVPYEITAAGLVIDYWNPPVNIAVWITIFIMVIVALNLLPVQFYGETEFWLSSLKVFLMIGLLLLSFILFWGGGPNQHGILGFHYWKDPGATNTWLEKGSTGRFCAFIGTLISSAFPFAFAPEMIVVTGGELQNPQRNLPKAAKRYFYRVVTFYIAGMLAIGIICPFNDARLTNGGVGAKSSAFVVGISDAGISGLGSVINAVIITSAWSSGNSFLYMSSRSLYSLAIAGNAPHLFACCSRHGVPYPAVIASALFMPLAYLNCANTGSTVFGWFVSLTNTSGFISWVCCSIVYLRFRKAYILQTWQTQNQDLPPSSSRIPNLPYTSIFQPWGSYIAIPFFTLLALINGFDVFFTGRFSASSFLTAYIGIPIFLVIYGGHRAWRWSDKWVIPSEEVDLVSGVERVAEEVEEADGENGGKGWKARLREAFT